MKKFSIFFTLLLMLSSCDASKMVNPTSSPSTSSSVSPSTSPNSVRSLQDYKNYASCIETTYSPSSSSLFDSLVRAMKDDFGFAEKEKDPEILKVILNRLELDYKSGTTAPGLEKCK